MTLTGQDNFIEANKYSDHIEDRSLDLLVSDSHQHVPGPSDDEPQMTIELVPSDLGLDIEVDFTRRLVTTEEFANMDPSHRNCLYKNEKKLEYYRSYSQVLYCIKFTLGCLSPE